MYIIRIFIMITEELKSKINKNWEIFWITEITNLLEVIEQFTLLKIFIRINPMLIQSV